VHFQHIVETCLRADVDYLRRHPSHEP
jgi:hypothetical protein